MTCLRSTDWARPLGHRIEGGIGAAKGLGVVPLAPSTGDWGLGDLPVLWDVDRAVGVLKTAVNAQAE